MGILQGPGGIFYDLGSGMYVICSLTSPCGIPRIISHRQLRSFHIYLIIFAFTTCAGTGKAVMASMVLHPFSESAGIEFLEGLHAVALELRDTFYDKIVLNVGEGTSLFESHLSHLSVHLDSLYVTSKVQRSSDSKYAISMGHK